MSERREQNRALLPFITGCFDALAAEGLSPRVIFAEENGHKVGREET